MFPPCCRICSTPRTASAVAPPRRRWAGPWGPRAATAALRAAALLHERTTTAQAVTGHLLDCLPVCSFVLHHFFPSRLPAHAPSVSLLPPSLRPPALFMQTLCACPANGRARICEAAAGGSSGRHLPATAVSLRRSDYLHCHHAPWQHAPARRSVAEGEQQPPGWPVTAPRNNITFTASAVQHPWQRSLLPRSSQQRNSVLQ